MKTAPCARYQWLARERDAYQKPSIEESLYIRSMYDEINELRHPTEFNTAEEFEKAVEDTPYCLVLEYLPYTLDQLDPESYKGNLVFVAKYFESMLNRALHIEQADAIWTGQ